MAPLLQIRRICHVRLQVFRAGGNESQFVGGGRRQRRQHGRRNMAAETLRDIRVADITDLDLHIENNKISSYRAKVKMSFKVEKHNI